MHPWVDLNLFPQVIIWDVRKCQLLRTLVGHKGVVFCVEMTEGTERVYSGSRDNSLRIWHTESGLCLKVIKVSLLYPVLSLHLNKEHLAACHGRRVTIWNTETWMKYADFVAHDNRVDSVQLSLGDHHAKPSGLLLTASQDGTVKYWDLMSYRCKTLSKSVGGNDMRKVNNAEFNDLYVVCGTVAKEVKFWDFNPYSKARQYCRKMAKD